MLTRSPIARKPRARKCAICREPATSAMNLKPFCSPGCGLELAKRTLAKQERARDKAKREKLLTQPQWVAKAQAAVNAYIRARDAGKPCICCGRYPQSYSLTGGEFDAGHYRGRGAAPELRYDERNIHGQLKQCNRRGFDVASYRANLINRIGLQAVEELEGPHPPRKWTIPDLQAIIAEYRGKLKALKGNS